MKYCIAAFLLTLTLAGCAAFNHDQPSVYVVFFPKASMELSADSQRIIAQAAQAVNDMHPSSVIIAAGASTGDNLQLAGPRFDAVHQALVSRGVDTALIARAAMPDTTVEAGGTADQRVEIRLISKAP